MGSNGVAPEPWLPTFDNRWGATATRLRLQVDRWRYAERVLATACWTFPIYSQTFVYEELRQMMEGGFALRFLYTEPEAAGTLPDAYAGLAAGARRSHLDPEAAETDLMHWHRRMPARVEDLVALIRQASGLPRDALLANPHFQMAFSYARLVEAFRPAWLHSYFFYEGTFFTFVASYLLGIPRGVSCYADHMLDDFTLKLVPLHLRTSSIVVATSQRIRQELLAMHPAPELDNILVKPNAIDSTRFPAVTRPVPEPGAPLRLACVARLEPKKGLIDLVEAVRLLIAERYPVELDIVGGPDQSPASVDYASRLERLVASLPVPAVRLHGRRPPEDVRRILEHAHVFVAPFVELDSGDKDGIPTALLEAMASGAAVVTTDAGSIVEPIQHGTNGLIVEQHSPRSLADAIASLHAKPELRRQLGEAAARTVRSRYDVRHCDAMLHDRMRAVIQAHATTRQDQRR